MPIETAFTLRNYWWKPKTCRQTFSQINRSSFGRRTFCSKIFTWLRVRLLFLRSRLQFLIMYCRHFRHFQQKSRTCSCGFIHCKCNDKKVDFTTTKTLLDFLLNDLRFNFYSVMSQELCDIFKKAPFPFQSRSHSRIRSSSGSLLYT